MADKPMSGMPTDSSIAGTERLLAQGADGSVILASALAAYTIDTLVAAAAITPTTGDAILVERAGTEGTFDLDATADYIIAYAWDNPTEADPAASGDMLLMERSNVCYTLDVDTLKTYVLVGIQQTVLNISGLDAVTLDSADMFPVCDGTTGKKVTLANLETKLWADLATYVADLTAVATSGDSDIYYVIQGGTVKYVTGETLSFNMSDRIITIGDVAANARTGIPAWLTALSEATTLAAADELLLLQSGTGYKATMQTIANYAMDATFELPWKEIEGSKYTALPASTSTLTMSDTSDISIGDPVKFVWSGNTYYAIVTAIAANALITIAGAPFSASIPLTALHVGPTSHVVTRSYFLDFVFGDGVDNLMASVGRYDRWEGAPAFLVSFAATQGTADTGASEAKINVNIAGAAVSTDDSNKGLQLSTAAGTWVANTAVQVSTSNYDIVRGDAIEIRCTEAGTNGDGSNLCINLIFVYE